MSIYGISGKETVVNNKKIERKVNQGKIFTISEDKDKEAEIIPDNINLLSSVNPFFVLNEINQEEKEREQVKKEGKKLLQSLNAIRLGLLNGELSMEIIKNLSGALDECNFSFTNAEIRSLIEDIKLRAEVEIAKFELFNH